MKTFEYADQEVGFKEMVVTVASMILAVGIITLPRIIAANALSSDGWISVLLVGGIASVLAFIAAKLASRFPGQSFLQYTSQIIPKPLAYILTILFALYALMNVAVQMRAVGDISKLYLFEETPTAAITLIFLLVVVYAVAGTRVGILRLNMMFFPIVYLVAIGICVMNINFFEMDQALPLFTSSWREILQGSKEMAYSLLGFELVLFYIIYMKNSKHAGKASVIGVNLVVLLYLLIYISCIFVFGREVTKNLIFPTIELAKQIMTPGGFVERFESLFFTIWMMTIFNTSAMAYDIALMTFHSIIKKGKKIVYLSILSPIVYFIGMMPDTLLDVFLFAELVSQAGLILAAIVPALLLLICKIRKIGNET